MGLAQSLIPHIIRPQGHVRLDADKDIVKKMSFAWDAKHFDGQTVESSIQGGAASNLNQGGVTLTEDSILGTAMTFPSATAYIRHTGSAKANTGYPFACATRIRSNFNGNDPVMFSSLNKYVGLRAQSANKMRYEVNGVTILSPIVHTTTEIVDVVGVSYSATDHKLYVNGVLEASSTTNKAYDVAFGDQPTIGYRQGASASFDGDMAWAYWFDDGLTEAEIFTLHTNPFSLFEKRTLNLYNSGLSLNATPLSAVMSVSNAKLGRYLSGAVTLNSVPQANAIIKIINTTDDLIEATLTSDALGLWSYSLPLGKNYILVVEYNSGNFKLTSEPHFAST